MLWSKLSVLVAHCAAGWCLTYLSPERHALICVAPFYNETRVLLFLCVGWGSSSATGSCYSSSKAGRLFTLSLCILNIYLFCLASLIITTYPDLPVCFYKKKNNGKWEPVSFFKINEKFFIKQYVLLLYIAYLTFRCLLSSSSEKIILKISSDPEPLRWNKIQSTADLIRCAGSQETGRVWLLNLAGWCVCTCPLPGRHSDLIRFL